MDNLHRENEGFQENGASKPEKNSFHNANCFGRQNHNDEYEKFTSPNSSKCNNFSGKGEDRKIYVRGISSQVTKDQQFSNTIEGEIYTDPIIVLFECCPNSETIQSLPFSFGQLRQIGNMHRRKKNRRHCVILWSQTFNLLKKKEFQKSCLQCRRVKSRMNLEKVAII